METKKKKNEPCSNVPSEAVWWSRKYFSGALGNVVGSVVGQAGQRLTNSIGSVVGGTQTGQITASVYDLNTASLWYDQSTDKESFLNCLVTPNNNPTKLFFQQNNFYNLI